MSTEALLTFKHHPPVRLYSGDVFSFGRSELNYDDLRVGRDCGRITIIDSGAIVAADPESSTPFRLHLGPHVVSTVNPLFPQLVLDSADCEVGAPERRTYRFSINVTLDEELHYNPPKPKPDDPRPTVTLDLNERQKDVIAACTIDFAEYQLCRNPASVELLGRKPPVDRHQMKDSIDLIADKADALGYKVPGGLQRTPFLCRLVVVDQRIVGPEDWDRVRPWIKRPD